jgi:two-component sensor histidine kinase
VSMTNRINAKISLSLPPLMVPLNDAVPAALIVNEVLTNCYKHGVVTPAAEIKVCLSSDGTSCQLTISDNGPGLPPAVQKNFGMVLIERLAQQLNGEYHFENKSGTFFSLRWPYPKEAIA